MAVLAALCAAWWAGDSAYTVEEPKAERVLAGTGRDGRRLARLDGSSGTAVAFTRDGTRILTAGGAAARVWDGRTYEPVTAPLKHERDVKAAAISPDGKRVATAAGRRAFVWDAGTGELLLALDHADRVFDVVFSPDGARLATACLDRSARVWDAGTGRLVTELKHDGPVRSVSFSPSDETALLIGTVAVDVGPERRKQARVDDPNALGDAQVWDLAGGRMRWQYRRRKQFDFCRGRPVFSADGKRVGVPAGSWAVVCDAATGDRVARGNRILGYHGVTIVDFDRRGVRLLGAGDEGPESDEGAAQVVELVEGPPEAADDPYGLPLNCEPVMALPKYRGVAAAAISPDGRTVVLVAGTAGERHRTGLWDVDRGEKVLMFARRWEDFFQSGLAPERVVAFSPDGRRVAVGSVDRRDGPANHTTVWGVPAEPPPQQQQ